MRMKYKTRNYANRNLVAAAVAAVVGLGSAAYPLTTYAADTATQPTSSVGIPKAAVERYTATINPLNKTGVSGTADFTLHGQKLKVTINATGLEPGVHPQHIHGKTVGAAECPTIAADINNDGFTSVVEGAPSYGLIKVNLTSPQTAFGTPPTPVLFDSFAGTPDNANFPVVGVDGILKFTSNYTFDSSTAAQAAFESIKNLGDQAIVLHVATAPKSVDADAFAALGKPFVAGTDLTQKSYDVLLPAACGVIDEAQAPGNGNGNGNGNDNDNDNGTNQADISKMLSASLSNLQGQLTADLNKAASNSQDSAMFNTKVTQLSGTFGDNVNKAVTNYQQSISSGVNKDEARNQLVNGLASAKDRELNGLSEARNVYIDQLNRMGTVNERDRFLSSFDKTVEQYKNVLESAKNSL